MRTFWTDEDVKRRTLEMSKRFGNRMPSCPELDAIGEGALGSQIGRRGAWKVAAECGLEVKESDSKFGIGVHQAEATRLRGLGFHVVEHTTKHPFDLTVDGVRVDTKASHYAEYPHKNGGTMSRGYFFALNKVPATCDLYLLVCEGGHRDGERYYVPASAAQQRMITITPTGKRFAAYHNALDVLIAMAADKTA